MVFLSFPWNFKTIWEIQLFVLRQLTLMALVCYCLSKVFFNPQQHQKHTQNNFSDRYLFPQGYTCKSFFYFRYFSYCFKSAHSRSLNFKRAPRSFIQIKKSTTATTTVNSVYKCHFDFCFCCHKWPNNFLWWIIRSLKDGNNKYPSCANISTQSTCRAR